MRLTCSNYLAKPRQQSDGVICKREQINGEEMARPAGFEPVAHDLETPGTTF